jgi:hypothetical protein
MEQQLFNMLNDSALVVAAMGFAYMVKVVVNDMKHDVAAMKELLQEIATLLKSQK